MSFVNNKTLLIGAFAVAAIGAGFYLISSQPEPKPPEPIPVEALEPAPVEPPKIALVESSPPQAVDESDRVSVDKGVSYVDITEGEGDSLVPGGTIRYIAKGWDEQGTLFWEAKRADGQPITSQFSAEQLYTNLLIGMEGMKVGGVRQIKYPAPLGPHSIGSLQQQGTMEVQLLQVLGERVLPPFPASVQLSPATVDRFTPEDGVKTGVVSEGTGDLPQVGQTVNVDFTAWDADGNLIRTSATRVEPLSITLGEGKPSTLFDEVAQQLRVGQGVVYTLPALQMLGKDERFTEEDVLTYLFTRSEDTITFD